ncbi:MAG: ATP-binding protein [Candidatus Manganitrophus sp.]|nr:MAG: ATP-binding protein [Candidatus Manganitrophus sp.]
MKKTPKVRQSNLAGPSQDLFVGGGEMGALMRSVDWSKTPLGPVASWPQSLKSALSIGLNTRFPIAIYWGSDLVLLYNDAWSPIPGTKHPWALGRPAREAWPEIWHIIGPLFEQVIRTGEGSRSEDQLLPMRRHGYTEECYFDYTFSPIRGESGQVVGIFNAVTETTYRVLSERRMWLLRELSERVSAARRVDEACVLATQALEAAAADVPFALIYLTDPNGREARLEAAFGIEPGTPAAPRSIDLTGAGDSPWPLGSVLRTGRGEVVREIPVSVGVLPGGPWPEPTTEVAALPLEMGRENIVGFLVAGASPRRALDESYLGFFQFAAGHIAKAISNARAYEEERQRAEALAELDRAKTVFFSNVSHEFRTPLTLMLGPIEEALSDNERPLPPEQRERVDLLHRNALRLLKLVNTLLDFSRIEAGRLQSVYEPTDLASLTADLASVFRSAIEKAGLRFVVDTPPLPEPIYVDREMWEKIVLNLLSNAFKFTFEGEIEVALRWAEDRVELTVRDTGTGIPKEELPHLFERFHRVKGARARTHEGSGIGLALVQELVRLHGGTIGVESEVDRGTTFTVTLPSGAAHLPADRIGGTRTQASTATGAAPYVEEALRWFPEARSAHPGVRNEEAALSGMLPSARILLADDNADMREYVKRILSRHWTIEAVQDGAAALAAARERAPDLVLTDVMMPEMNGFELLQTLRADPRTREIPVILLSARAGEESRVEGLEAGADDYLVKPFSARELTARVGAHLELARLRRETLQSEQQLRLEAEEANRFKSQFFSSVSHDLRTPLNAIVGYLHLLETEMYGPVAEDQKKPLDGIQRNVRELLRLINDVLDLARIDSGKMSLELSSVRLASIIEEITIEMKPLLEMKSLSIHSHVPENLPDIDSDAMKIKQIVTNLVSNAVKFTEKGGVTIRVENLPEEGWIEMTVSDTGMGIEPESLPKIFESFYQVEESRAFGGSGLGLTIVKELVHLLQGKIRVTSEVGVGSTFTIFLPYRFPT